MQSERNGRQQSIQNDAIPLEFWYACESNNFICVNLEISYSSQFLILCFGQNFIFGTGSSSWAEIYYLDRTEQACNAG